MAKILKATEENLDLCKQQLDNSRVIAVPTETVYGLAGNALDKIALNTIFEIKERPLFNPLIIHTDSIKSAQKYAVFNHLALKLAEIFWPGPLTMILPKKNIVPDLVTANLDSVAIRCPHNQTFRRLLERLSYPLAAPSANPFGYISPTSAEHVNCSLGDKLDYILNGDKCDIGLESTIVDLRSLNEPKILRPGPISKKELEGLSDVPFEEAKNASAKELRAPGMLKSHYSPTTSLQISSLNKLKLLASSGSTHKIGFIFQKRPENSLHQESPNIHWLSENGEEIEIARNFYKVLRTADNENYNTIYIEEIFENEGLRVAIKDRLIKAASK